MTRIKPLLFVAMPFGQKDDPSGTYKIDFDRVYELAIRPAAAAADLDVIRADEERGGGIIHAPMFERLLLAEIVVADLTTLNPNVFYELGVRHCARPRTTILIFAPLNQLPFDVHLIRAIPYALDRGVLSEAAGADLRRALEGRLRRVVEDLEARDSPLFELISNFPGISLPPESTATFRERALLTQRVHERLGRARRLERQDRAHALQEIDAVAEEIGDPATASPALLVDLLLSYRDVRCFDEMIALVERLPDGPTSRVARVRELHAFALSRRNGAGDRDRAEGILQDVIAELGPSSEACGLLARIHKDRFEEARSLGRELEAGAYLDQAISLYRAGFHADPRDYYPGINAATLLYFKGDAASLAELELLRPAVLFAATRRGGVESADFWVVATVLEAAALGDDWGLALRAAARLLVLRAPGWTLDSTVRNLTLIKQARAARGLPTNDLDEVVGALRR